MSLTPIQIVPYVLTPGSVAIAPGSVATVSSEPNGQESDAPFVSRASRSVKKYLPDPVISEDWLTHQLIFDLPVPAENRELATLEYQEGIQQKGFVDARSFHEVESLHSEKEIEAVKEIISAHCRGGSLWEEARLKKLIERELRLAVPDPVKLDRWEASLRQLFPFAYAAREFESSSSERVLALVVTMKRLKALYANAQGWKSKAQRQAACGVFGQQWDSGCGRSFFRRFRCKNRYCKNCGGYIHDQLVEKYLKLSSFVDGFLSLPESRRLDYRLRIFDITARKRGDRMPSVSDVHRFKLDVKNLVSRINRHVAAKFGVKNSKQLTGYLYCLEFGFDNNNLHCHGLLLSPYLEEKWLEMEWSKVRGDGSFKVHIAEATSFDAAIKHALEYTGKYSNSTPERAFELEKAFAGCRRVDGLGLFFNRLPDEEKESVDLRCPCGDSGCFLHLNEAVGFQLISYFDNEGIRDLDEIRAQSRGAPRRGKALLWVN